MATESTPLFDHNYPAQLLLDIAHEHSLDHLLHKLVDTVIQHPQVAGGQIWLVEKGDLCSSCPHRPECPDQTRCLHLAAGGAAPGSEAGKALANANQRAPLGVGLLGEAALSGKVTTIKKLSQRQLQAFNLRAEEVRGGSAAPIIFKNEVLGMVVVLTHKSVPPESLYWIRIFADHLGAAIANARAFDEIQRLKAQLEQQNAYLREEVQEARAFGDLVGSSAALRQIASQIDLVAPTDASVLILGETGTGKELVAREIHRRSARADGPLVRVNCASIPKELFESEFFGHVKGAFTGAVKDRAGRFEAAEGGTIFLDEVGEIPLEMQAKLLRVLQEKRYERVGEDRTRIANVRVISATNQDLKEAVAAGRFREDLYYRLHVFPIHVPPLRERKEDIPLLAPHFVRLSVKELRCPAPRLTPAGLAGLQHYDWPGNIRELRNVIERAVILARGGPLHFELPTAEPASPAPVASPAAPADPPAFLTEAELRARQRANLLAVLTSVGWKIKGPGGAAERLGVKPTTLLSRMKRAGIRRSVST